jgi:hypothetical protein
MRYDIHHQRFKITYDDGEEEWLNLINEEFR